MRQSPSPTKVNVIVPDFLPFRGLRYRPGTDLSKVVAPPYDVIDEEERVTLERTDDHNAVRLILPGTERAPIATPPRRRCWPSGARRGPCSSTPSHRSTRTA